MLNTNLSRAKPNSSQIRASSSKARPNFNQGNPWISFAKSSLIKGLRRPPGAFFLFAPLPALKEPTGPRQRRPFARVSVSFPWSSFRGPLACSNEVKGWRLFLIADARAPVPSDPGGRRASLREKENPSTGQRPEDPRMKTGRSIRCPARIRPPRQARTGFGPNGQADERQPFMPQEYLTIPASEPYPFGCAYCEADAAAFKSGALRAPFVQRHKNHHSIIPFSCKENGAKKIPQKPGEAE